MDLFFGTTNPGKLRELRRLVAGLAVRVLSIEDLGRPVPEVEEDGATFAENAAKKALHYARYCDGPLFADDSGLEVDALGSAPGVYSARYSGEHATDEGNNRLLLENLRGVADRTARFVCAIALVEAGEVQGVWRGAVEGRILDAARGAHGFGYDPLFYYDPFGCTFGEADDDRKFSVSHRGQALRAMLAALAL